MATGTFSSRRIEQATYDSLAFRFIACDQHPDHDTLASFRRRFGAPFAAIFVQVLDVARENQLSRFGPLSLDGTKLHANASRHRALSYCHAKKADTGYFSEKNVDACHSARIAPLIAVGRDEHYPDWRERFEEPAPLSESASQVEQMKHALKTKAGRALYALRKQTVEPVFGIIKSVMGFRQFLLRGLANIGTEWTLVCLAWNLKRMAATKASSPTGC
jgi:hypothetical protein